MALNRPTVLWFILLLLLTGCNLFQRQRQPKVPPPPTPAPMKTTTEVLPPPKPKAMDYPLPPKLEPESRTLAMTRPPLEPQIVIGPPPKAPATREPVKQEPREVAEQPAPAPVPQLTQLLTPEEERRYNEEIDGDLSRVRKNLEMLTGRSLNDEQQRILDRINAFVKQTLDRRKNDLVTAKALAQRADLLARDLERTTR